MIEIQRFLNPEKKRINFDFQFFEMGLTWEEFLQLAAVLTNLRNSIKNFNLDPQIDIKEKNRRVAAAAFNYQEFFNDLKYIQFMEKIRISCTKILEPCSK